METTMQRRRVVCPENEGLAESMWKKRQEMAEKKSKGLSENIDMTLRNAYYNVCTSRTPITTLKGFSQIKGVGKWILRLMQEFFETDSGGSQNEDFKSKGKTSVRTKRYVPQKNSVAYALLVTLYREVANGRDFMHKQELIDAAEASGLSRVPIAPEKGKGKPGQFGSSPRDWYSGWSCMKTLITKGLVVKSSCPAKYMLTEEGQESARECLSRSGQIDLITTKGLPNLGPSSDSDLGVAHDNMAKDMMVESISLSQQPMSIDVFRQSLDRVSPA